MTTNEKFLQDMMNFMKQSNSDETYNYYIDSCDSSIEYDHEEWGPAYELDYPNFKFKKEFNGDNCHEAFLVIKGPSKKTNFLNNTLKYDVALISDYNGELKVVDSSKKTYKEIYQDYGPFANYFENIDSGANVATCENDEMFEEYIKFGFLKLPGKENAKYKFWEFSPDRYL